jgi:hypothetical protein
MVFKMPWPGDPRVNLQDSSEGAKPYQVRQLLAAIDRLHVEATADDAKESKAGTAEAGKKKPATRARKGKRHG